jgi:hypothetical protein
MTKKERANPALLQASRKKRIAAGAGQDVSDLNKLLKMQRQMADAMKKLGKMGKKGMMRGGLGALMGKGAPQALKDMDPASMDPKAMEAAARQLGQGGLARPRRRRTAPRPLGFRQEEVTAQPLHIPTLETGRLILRAPRARTSRPMAVTGPWSA